MDVRRMASYRMKPTGYNSSSVTSLRKLTGKKASLLELINSGKNYTTEEKTKILNTSESNVYKMTSELKKEGFISQGTSEGLRGNASDGITMFLDSVHYAKQKPALEKNQLIDSPTRKRASSSNESKRTQAFKLFRKGVKDLEIAIRLDVSQEELFSLKKEYLRLIDSDSLHMAYEEFGEEDFELILDVCALKTTRKMRAEDFKECLQLGTEFVNVKRDLPVAREQLAKLRAEIREKEQLGDETSSQISKKQEELRAIDEEVIAHNKQLMKLKSERANLREDIAMEKRFIKDLHKTELYLKFGESVKEKIHEALSKPPYLARLYLDSILDLIRQDPSVIGLLQNYKFYAIDERSEQEFRERVQNVVLRKIKNRIIKELEKQSSSETKLRQ